MAVYVQTHTFWKTHYTRPLNSIF